LRDQGHDIRYVDAGGGLGISYEEAPQEFEAQIAGSGSRAEAATRFGRHLLLEPGRSIVGAAGLLVTRVIYRKTNNSKRFLIVDAGMNDLLRPALYGAYHEICRSCVHRRNRSSGRRRAVCETGDFFRSRPGVAVLADGELLAILDAGAYGAVLGSNYNTRGKTGRDVS